MTRDLAERAGFHPTPAPAGRDAAGDAVPSWNVGDVPARIGASDVTLRDVVAIEGPEPFGDWGVGGFLSPQTVAVESTVVLDLGAHTMDVIDGDPTKVAADLMARFGDCLALFGARHLAGTVGIEVQIPPAPPVVALFDTGAAETEVAAVAIAAGVDEMPKTSGHGVGGSAIRARSVRDARLDVGGVRLQVAVLSVRDEIPAPADAADDEVPRALIGMDLLHGTALAIAPRDHGSVSWFIPKALSGERAQ